MKRKPVKECLIAEGKYNLYNIKKEIDYNILWIIFFLILKYTY